MGYFNIIESLSDSRKEVVNEDTSTQRDYKAILS